MKPRSCITVSASIRRTQKDYGCWRHIDAQYIWELLTWIKARWMKAKICACNHEQGMKRSEVLRTSILYSQEVKWLNYTITKSHTSVIALSASNLLSISKHPNRIQDYPEDDVKRKPLGLKMTRKSMAQRTPQTRSIFWSASIGFRLSNTSRASKLCWRRFTPLPPSPSFSPSRINFNMPESAAAVKNSLPKASSDNQENERPGTNG